MKKNNLVLVLTLGFICGLGSAVLAHADESIVANVPFNFVVGQQVLPSGSYTVTRIESPNGTRIVKISGEDGNTVLLVPSAFDDFRTQDQRLSFQRAGTNYYLDGIKTSGGTYTINIPHSALTVAQMEKMLSDTGGK